MGQYYILVNVDKHEYVTSSISEGNDGGSKFVEWCTSTQSFVFPYLLGLCNGYGGGDVDAEKQGLKLLGRWAGDKVVLVGDYWGQHDDKAPFGGLYKEVRSNDGDLKGYAKRIKEKEKYIANGCPGYYSGPGTNKYDYYIPDQKKKVAEMKVELERLKQLKKEHPEQLWRCINDELRADFERAFGKGSLDLYRPQGGPDMVLSVPRR